MQDVLLFTSQGIISFYDKLFSCIEFVLPRASTGRKGFPKEAMLCAFIDMKCEGFNRITDLLDFLQCNLIIAHYCGFDITRPLPSYWTFDRFLRRLENGKLKEIMAAQVRKLYELGVLDASFIGLDSTPVAASTVQNNPKTFGKSKFAPENHPRNDPDCALGVHTASNQHNEKNCEFYWGYKNHILVDCISGLPIYEITTPANVADSTVALDILSAADRIIPVKECTFIADKGYDVKAIYNAVRDVYQGEALIPLNQRNTRDPAKLPVGNLLCEAGFAMHKDGKTSDAGRTRQKFCCPLRRSRSGICPCNHKNWNNGKKNRGCTRYVTIPDDYRPAIDRTCASFKRTCALRKVGIPLGFQVRHRRTATVQSKGLSRGASECERYNARFKDTGQARLWIHNGASAENLNTIAHIAALTIALAAVSFRLPHSYRARKALRRAA